MPFELRGTVNPVPRGATRYSIAKYDVLRGTLVVPPFIHPFNDNKGIAVCAKKMGVNQLVIANLIIELQKPGVTNAVTALDDVGPEHTLYLRQSTDRTAFPDFSSALSAGMELVEAAKDEAEYVADNTYIEWTNSEQLCVLDVDFHYIDATPYRTKLESFCDIVQPAPTHWWLTKRGGLHLVYALNAQFNADELAAVAAYQAIEKFPTCKIEMIPRTRLPPHGEVSHTRVASNDMDAIRSILHQVPQHRDYSEFRTAKGWTTVLQRFDHTHCPVAPDDRGKGWDTCVVVLDGGIDCKRCHKDGVCYGSRKPGFFPYAALAGDIQRSEVARCVEKFTHWTHAQYIVQRTIQQSNVAKKIYGALLKLQHGTDPRIPHVFVCDDTKPMIRANGYWMTEFGERMPMNKDSAILAALPAAMTVTDDGEVKTRMKDVEVYAMTNDLTRCGYPPISAINGIQLTAMQALPPNKLFAVLEPKYAQYEGEGWRVPKYVADVDDEVLQSAFALLEKVVPGIDRNLLYLLLCGRGCIEHRSGISPMLFLSGVTKAGKTSHCRIAAAILGDTVGTVPYRKNQERLMQSIMTAKTQSGFIVFDEFMKNARLQGGTVEDAFLILLNFDKRSRSHVMYTGPVELGDLPFFIWCDTDYPDAIAGNEQVGRRLHYLRMHRQVEWTETLKDAGIEEPEKMREQGSKELVNAMNCILSYVMDRWFTSGPVNFDDVARELGIIKMESYGGVSDKNAIIKELFANVCKAPDISDAKVRKYITQNGMKLAQAGADCAIYDACDALLTDEERQSGKLPVGIRAMNESDVGKLIGADCPVRFEIKAISWQRFGVRFVSNIAGDMRVNQELVCDQSTECIENTIDMSLPFTIGGIE